MSDMKKFINIINENDDISITRAGKNKADTAAGIFTKATATVTGKTSESYTKLAKKFKEADELTAEAEALRAEANAEIKKRVADLFDATDAVLTRYVDTQSLAITMAKDTPEKTTQTSVVDHDAIYEAIFEVVDEDLVPVIKKLIEAHTKVRSKTVPAKTGAIKVKLPESTGGMLDRVKTAAANILRKVTTRMTAVDNKLANIKEKAGLK